MVSCFESNSNSETHDTSDRCLEHKVQMYEICDGVILVVMMTRRGRKERVAA